MTKLQIRWAFALVSCALIGLVMFLRADLTDDASEKSLTDLSAPVRVSGAHKPAPELLLKKRVEVPLDEVDLFQIKHWFVPPPPPPAAKPMPVVPVEVLPPPEPVPPPFPYVFVGAYDNLDGTMIIHLSMANKLYSVKVGEVLGGTYRIEAFKDGQLSMMYLPLNKIQTLAIGDK